MAGKVRGLYLEMKISAKDPSKAASVSGKF